MHVMTENNLILIYIGFFFCICIALFDSYDAISSRHRQRSEKRATKELLKLMKEQTLDFLSGTYNEQSARKQFKRRLRYDRTLLSVETSIDLLLKEYKLEISIEDLINLWFSVLIDRYKTSELVVKEYLIFLIGKYKVNSGKATYFLSEMISRGEYELKEEALYSICKQNNPILLKRTLRALNRLEEPLNRKIITDALNNFSGTTEEKENIVLADFFILNDHLKVGIIDFMDENYSITLKENLIDLLENKKTDKEVRLAIIKYFGRHYYPPAKRVLLEMADNRREWEYAAVAATSMHLYPGEDTVEQAAKRMTDANWYVRYNNSMTLSLIADDERIEDILQSKDRYARESMLYAKEKTHK